MPVSEKDRLAADVAERYAVFEQALFRDSRRYPLQEFKSFREAGMRHAELTRSDPADSPEGGRSGAPPDGSGGVERKRIPANVPWDAERWEGPGFQWIRSSLRRRRTTEDIGGAGGTYASFRKPHIPFLTEGGSRQSTCTAFCC